MSRARLLLLGILCAIWPAHAFAQSDIYDWLQGGSGPGPYTSKFTGFEVRVWCKPTGVGLMDTAKRQVWNCLLDDPDRTRAVVSFGALWASSENGRLFIDDPTDVRGTEERWLTGALIARQQLLSAGGYIDALGTRAIRATRSASGGSVWEPELSSRPAAPAR
jgi:hypothetical protein